MISPDINVLQQQYFVEIDNHKYIIYPHKREVGGESASDIV
jgi:hypothetical protein